MARIARMLGVVRVGSIALLFVGCSSTATTLEEPTPGEGGAGPDGRAPSDAHAGSEGGNTADAPGGGADAGAASDAHSAVSDAGGTADTGTTLRDGATTASDSGAIGMAGNPNGSCSTGIPTQGQPVDTSHPTTVVGTGTPASCTFSQLEAAVTAGGTITFDCGSAAVTIPVTATLNLPIDRNTVIDGGNKVTLDGGQAVQILRFDSPNFQATDFRLTLQHIALVNGKMTPTQAIPPAPAPCSQGWDDGEGGALYMRDGNLTVIDSIFANNQAALLGPDTGGGAIYLVGSKRGALIVSSTFTSNTASNGAAVGGLFAELDVYNSLFTGNTAAGNGANNDDPTKCSAMNNGQNEVGSGGNGGALYSDGNSVNVVLCGDAITGNAAGMGAFGGGLFFTSDNMMGTLTITDTTMTGNTGGHWTNATTGVMNAGTAIGVNAKSITITNSTLQGYP
jgi:hypothetical protein